MRIYRYPALVFLFFMLCSCNTETPYEFAELYTRLPFSMERVERPAIPDREVVVTEFGAKGDGIFSNTKAFETAIWYLSNKGGGRLIVPSGIWLTGPIQLQSNIELHIDKGGVILFSSNIEEYPIVDATFQGVTSKRCMPPISAVNANNIAITGEGIIDGSGDAWRPVIKNLLSPKAWADVLSSGPGVLNESKDIWFPSQESKKGFDMSNSGVMPALDDAEAWESIKDFLRPALFSFRRCDNILLENVVIQNSPSWSIHPFLCNNIIIKNITVLNPRDSYTGDGIVVESCRNVIITKSSFDLSNDAICLKSGRGEEGRKRGIPSENVVIDDCSIFHGGGGFAIGSEMSGGIRNISLSNCRFLGTAIGLRFKSCRGRGGVVENVYIRDVSMTNIVEEPISFDLFYKDKGTQTLDGYVDIVPREVDRTTPLFRNIKITNLACQGARRAIFFNGLPEMNLRNISIHNSSISSMSGAMIYETDSLDIANLYIAPKNGAAMMLRNVKHAIIEDFICPYDIPVSLFVDGSRNKNITVNSRYVRSNNVSIVSSALKEVNIGIKGEKQVF